MGIFDSITSLLGGAKKYGADADLSAGRGYLGQEGGIANTYGGLGASALSQYGTDNGQYRSALGGYEDYLKQDPYTDNYSTAQLARATEGTTQAYTRARANLAAAAAGTGQGGGASSMLAGGEQGINTAAAGQVAGQQNALGMARIAQHGQNLAQLANLTGSVANTDYGRGVNAYGAQLGVLGHLGGEYLGLGQNERSMEMQSQAQADSSLYGLAGAAGSYLGLRNVLGNSGNAGYGNAGYGGLGAATANPYNAYGGGAGLPLDYGSYNAAYPQITPQEYYSNR